MKEVIIILIGILLLNIETMGQIQINNNSFEGEVQDATEIAGWINIEDSTPDILPGVWGVYLDPVDGETYVGLVTRADKRIESIGQLLQKKLEKGKCYQGEVIMTRANVYAGYNGRTKLRIWGGIKRNNKDILLDEIEPNGSEIWETYSFELNPEEDCYFIILEAYYCFEGRKKEKPYNGNLLIDYISEIKLCE